jgi:hypothetical protein
MLYRDCPRMFLGEMYINSLQEVMLNLELFPNHNSQNKVNFKPVPLHNNQSHNRTIEFFS